MPLELNRKTFDRRKRARVNVMDRRDQAVGL